MKKSSLVPRISGIKCNWDKPISIEERGGQSDRVEA